MSDASILHVWHHEAAAFLTAPSLKTSHTLCEPLRAYSRSLQEAQSSHILQRVIKKKEGETAQTRVKLGQTADKGSIVHEFKDVDVSAVIYVLHPQEQSALPVSVFTFKAYIMAMTFWFVFDVKGNEFSHFIHLNLVAFFNK